MKKLWLLLLVLLPVVGVGQVITTVVGTGVAGHFGDGGPSTSASISDPHGGFFDKYGNLYIAQGYGGHRIRKVDAAGIVSTVAGTGVGGYNGDGIAASIARITPNAVTVDSIGNLYITDSARIRKINITTGIISTIGGGGSIPVGDGGPATAASLHVPWGICFDKYGNLYFGEGIGYRLRKINTAGIISTVVGNGIAGFGGDGGPATAAQCGQVFGICIDNIGNIFFADYTNNERVRKIDTAGIITTVAGNGIYTYSGDGIPATNAHIDPLDVKIDVYNNLFIVDFANSRIRKVDASGIIHTVAGIGINGYNGDGILATAAKIYYPGGLALDSCGNVFFGDVGNARFRKVTFTATCAPTLQTEQIKPLTKTSIYPNPATTELTISAPGKIKEVGVYDLLGRELTTPQPLLKTGGEMLRIPVAGFSPGIYFVRIVDDCGGVVVRRVVKE